MIEIFEFKKGDGFDINELIKKVYDEFVSIDYTEEGNKFFYNFIQAENFVDRYEKSNNIILIAKQAGKTIGIIEIRSNNQISLLFVDKLYHGQGIARKLFDDALKRCKLRNKNIDKFYVHASPFSIPVYERLGFYKTDEMKEDFGLKYLPMEMDLK